MGFVNWIILIIISSGVKSEAEVPQERAYYIRNLTGELSIKERFKALPKKMSAIHSKIKSTVKSNQQ